MGKRKRPKKKKTHPSLLISPDEEKLTTSLLENLNKITPANIYDQIPNPLVAQALVERLPLDEPEVSDPIMCIKDAFQQKGVQKAIKKVLFRLKQRGIIISGSEHAEEAPIHIVNRQEAEPSAYLSHIDGAGNRGIFMTVPQVPKGVDLGMGVINDEKGIIQFLFARYSKKRMREVQNLFFSNFRTIVEASVSHAATMLEKSYSQNREGLTELSKGYLQFRPWLLGNVTLMERSAIYDFIPPEDISLETLSETRMNRLLDHELLASWMVDPERIKSLAEEMQKVEESPIVVSELQQKERIKDLKRKAISDIYPEEKRSILKSRLEEMAYVFLKLGDEEIARVSLSAAVSLDKRDSMFESNPFLDGLLERSLSTYSSFTVEGGKQEEDSTSLIFKP
ncbi:MAG: hypothetical protein ABII26_02900 [Pseudomonadota bacterium]